MSAHHGLQTVFAGIDGYREDQIMADDDAVTTRLALEMFARAAFSHAVGARRFRELESHGAFFL